MPWTKIGKEWVVAQAIQTKLLHGKESAIWHGWEKSSTEVCVLGRD